MALVFLGSQCKTAVTSLGTYLMLTAAQRMDADKHWAPDVFLGAAAGLTAGYSICTAHEAVKMPRTDSRHPNIVPTGNGLALAWSF